jgi:dTDP-4-amino-4,6-dideoxygalactose transaminase
MEGVRDGRIIEFSPPSISDDDVDAVVRTLRGGWLTSGEECERLEVDLADLLGVPHVITMSSCTAALQAAFAHLDLPAGSRVGVPTWTFPSSALAPHRHGGVPVLLDVDPDSLNVSVEAVERALDDGLAALVIVHVAGNPVDPLVRKVAGEAGVPVVEDAAHALPATDDRGVIGGQGSLAACFSFYATKNIAAGEGGALTTEDADLAAFARAFRLHGLTRETWRRFRDGDLGPPHDVVLPGIKANLADPLAALARSQLARLDQLQAARRAAVERYRANLAAIDDLRCVPSVRDPGSADHLMVVLLPEGVDRQAVSAMLDRAGVRTGIHFPPLHTFTWFKEHAELGPGGTPVADAMAPRVLSLPLHAQITPAQIDQVCDALATALG